MSELAVGLSLVSGALVLGLVRVAWEAWQYRKYRHKRRTIDDIADDRSALGWLAFDAPADTDERMAERERIA
jgi:hypothetical protein